MDVCLVSGRKPIRVNASATDKVKCRHVPEDLPLSMCFLSYFVLPCETKSMVPYLHFLKPTFLHSYLPTEKPVPIKNPAPSMGLKARSQKHYFAITYFRQIDPCSYGV